MLTLYSLDSYFRRFSGQEFFLMISSYFKIEILAIQDEFILLGHKGLKPGEEIGLSGKVGCYEDEIKPDLEGKS